MSERFLVTGVLGCIGAWSARALLRDGAEVVGYDLGESRHRLELVLEPDELARVDARRAATSPTSRSSSATLDEHEITHLVHLAALQVPFCRANPPLGAAVNVVGTVNVFEAVKRRRERLRHVVYVQLGRRLRRGRPRPRRGRAHAAGHALRRLQGRQRGQRARLLAGRPAAAFALRPYTVYGPGRDQGMTSTPTQAMLAAARGEEFRIPYGGSAPMQHAEDVARVLVAAARADLEGAHVFNMGGGRRHGRRSSPRSRRPRRRRAGRSRTPTTDCRSRRSSRRAAAWSRCSAPPCRSRSRSRWACARRSSTSARTLAAS